MDIYDIAQNLKFSTGAYIENAFQSRIAHNLSKQAIDNIVLKARQEVLDQNIEEDSNQFKVLLNLKLNQKVNDIISATGKSVYDNFINNHKENSIEIYKYVDQEDFLNHFLFELKVIIPMVHMQAQEVQEIFEQIKNRISILYTDELSNTFESQEEASMVPYVQKNTAILLINEEKVVFKKEHMANALMKIMKKVITQDHTCLDLINDLMHAVTSIKIYDQPEDFQRKTVQSLLDILFFKDTKYSEVPLDTFLTRTFSGYGKNYYNDQVTDKQTIYEVLLDRGFEPESFNKSIMNKILKM